MENGLKGVIKLKVRKTKSKKRYRILPEIIIALILVSEINIKIQMKIKNKPQKDHLVLKDLLNPRHSRTLSWESP